MKRTTQLKGKTQKLLTAWTSTILRCKVFRNRLWCFILFLRLYIPFRKIVLPNQIVYFCIQLQCILYYTLHKTFIPSSSPDAEEQWSGVCISALLWFHAVSFCCPSPTPCSPEREDDLLFSGGKEGKDMRKLDGQHHKEAIPEKPASVRGKGY